ncbi:MAG: MFS transporter [Melioribacteraceae bacterium]|nr:MFS transporter [Melioribacteraceae bacterium]
MIIKKSLSEKKVKSVNPWSWIPTLYFAEGLPFVIVITVSVIMYKRLGISNTDIALYTSWLYLPWVIKPLWSPVVDILKTKRFWITTMQLIIGAGMAGVAFTIPIPDFFQFTLAFFWLLAFSSATHDIAADGFYMLALSESQQSFFVGIRSAFYRIAMFAGQGLLVILAGFLESTLSVGPAEFKVSAKPEMFFQQTIQVDSSLINALEGKLKLIASPQVLEVGTRPITKDAADFYINFAHKFNIMNGFKQDVIRNSDTSSITELVGNVAILKLHLSKQPDKGDEYLIDLKQIEGSSLINVIEGSSIKFTSKNWNKPAFVVVQLDPMVQQNLEATFLANSEKTPIAWVFTFGVIALLFILFSIYHRFILPQPSQDKSVLRSQRAKPLSEFFLTFIRFFEKEKILIILGFLLLYTLGESQLVKMASPFMLDPHDSGGLGLSTSEVGFIYGTVGMIALILGGILGGILISKSGLKKWLWWMLVAINIPNVVYVYMSYIQPVSLFLINVCVAIEQFGYGFGFTAYIMYMIFISDGEYKTSHYAIATGFMALGMMVPGMFSGMIQESIGYKYFFIWVLIAAIPSFIITKYIPLDSTFGKKTNSG